MRNTDHYASEMPNRRYCLHLAHLNCLSAFDSHLEAFMPQTVWAGSCRSWFKNGKETGPVTALHHGSRLHWFHMLEKFRGEDFKYAYEKGQRFGYLGNGFSTKELGEG
ncbi:hypothetical protein B0O99DRAFT_626342 [Bisporella sp. PMI_857]|nr:hypothetical protein B0O99DRAFT_626342 [Bisporella sp. PMI_857]